MNALRLAALAALALLASPAGSAATSAFAVSCGSVAAGGDVPCTVTRTSGGKGLYVLFATSDVTAHAGVDYTAVKQLLYFRASQVTAAVAVHTAINPAATGTLTFTASVAASSVPASATGSIVEPAPAPVPTPIPTPAPPPAPAPTGNWIAAPLTVGGYAWLKNQGPCCNGLIVKIVDGGMTNDADPALRQHWWAYVYYSDASGSFPATNPYWASAWMTGFDEGLQGVAPAP